MKCLYCDFEIEYYPGDHAGIFHCQDCRIRLDYKGPLDGLNTITFYVYQEVTNYSYMIDLYLFDNITHIVCIHGPSNFFDLKEIPDINPNNVSVWLNMVLSFQDIDGITTDNIGEHYPRLQKMKAFV